MCDHSVEIQIPFLQSIVPGSKVLPAYVGQLSSADRESAASRLRWLLNDDTVFIASSDLTHYGRDFGFLPFPTDEDTGDILKTMDEEVIAVAGSLDADLFLNELRDIRSTVCGYQPIGLLLELLRNAPDEEIFQETLDYQTSGEITSDYAHSVSYGALAYFPYSARRTLVEWQLGGERYPVRPRDLAELT